MAIPVSKKPSGYFHGSRSSKVQIDAFHDIQCPYSAKAWPVITELCAHYGDRIGLSMHLMVLSNHHQSWDITLLLFGLAGNDDARFWAFADHLYRNQERFFNGVFADQTHNDLRKLATELAREFDGTSAEEALARMDDDGVYANAKQPIRYAASKGVWSTPTYFINSGELSNIGSSSSLEDWRAIIDSLLED